MKSYCIALLFATIASVIAQSNKTPFYITSPLPGTVLKAGDSVDLEWNNGLDQTVNVVMIQGQDSGTMKATDISFNVQGDDGSYTFQVPKTLADAGTYAFQFEYKDQDGLTQYAYSGPFKVDGGSGTISLTASSAAPTIPTSSSAVMHSITPSAAIASSASSTPSVAAAAAASTSKNTSPASSTPTPNSSSGIKAFSFGLVISALMMIVLSA